MRINSIRIILMDTINKIEEAFNEPDVKITAIVVVIAIGLMTLIAYFFGYV